MIRIIGAVMIVAASAAIGAVMNARLSGRVKHLEGFIAALEQLKSDICFSDYGMEQALLRADGVSKTGGVFKDTAKNMKELGLKSALKKAVDDKKDVLCLHTADADAISALGKRLGLTDAEDQRKNIDGVISVLKIQCEEARADYKKNGRVYRGMGTLLGVLAALVLM